jgi:hypothetical protein
VKILEGINKQSSDLNPMSTNEQMLSNKSPDSFSGPFALSFLDGGNCFTGSHEHWEYHFCPYRNVTSRRIVGSSTNLLGVWGNWIETESGNAIMEYGNGMMCNTMDQNDPNFQKRVKTTVEILCNNNPLNDSLQFTEVKIYQIEEKTNCHYHLKFAVPIHCRLLHTNVKKRF